MEPLNKDLFRALERKFGHVEIVNEGERAQVSRQPNYYFADGRAHSRMQVNVTGGESYKVSCPWCDDTRKRLYFNYLWGTVDPVTNTQLLHLVHCFNEDCVDNRHSQTALLDMLDPHRRHRRQLPNRAATTKSPAVVDSESPRPRKMRPPEGCIRITDPDVPRAARQYLRDRGFSVRELERVWSVSYCEQSDSPPPKIWDRIVIPVRALRPGLEIGSDKRRVIPAGWQARSIGEPQNGVPKYLTSKGMKKSQLLYGLPVALESSGPIVVVEGVTDVWRLRTNAVALFGKTVSRHQHLLLLQHFQRRPLVVFLDRDARAEAEDVVQKLRSARSACGDDAIVELARPPKGRDDVGECDRTEAWSCVARALGVSPKTIWSVSVPTAR